jgi:hypothetical protein
MFEGIHQRFSIGSNLRLLLGVVFVACIVTFNVTEQKRDAGLVISVQQEPVLGMDIRSPLVATTMENDEEVVSVIGDTELAQSSSTEEKRAKHRVLRGERPMRPDGRPPFGRPSFGRPPFGPDRPPFFASPAAPAATAAASQAPSQMPSTTQAPSQMPSNTPSMQPSSSLEPSQIPSTSPSARPSQVPSITPSTMPSTAPSARPSQVPSNTPSTQPSSSVEPSQMPSTAPSTRPSQVPSNTPSTQPSSSVEPSQMPSTAPSARPSISLAPSQKPSSLPSALPSTSSSAPSISSSKKSNRPKAAKVPKTGMGKGRSKRNQRTFGREMDPDNISAARVSGVEDNFVRFPLVDIPFDVLEAMQP